MNTVSTLNERELLNKLKHYLPTQAPLKDFVHHNTLHSFQDLSFFEAIRSSAVIFGNKTTFVLKDYKQLFEKGKITEKVLDQVILNSKGNMEFSKWKQQMFLLSDPEKLNPRIGKIRKNWKNIYKIDIDTLLLPDLFKIVGSFIDQGINEENFPDCKEGFIDSIIEIQKNSLIPLVKSPRAKKLLLKKDRSIFDLLEIIVGNEKYYEQYLFDQQFSHPGWSGMVVYLENNKDTLLDKREIRFDDFVYFELLLEIDIIESKLSDNFIPFSKVTNDKPVDLFSAVCNNEYWDVLKLWQEAFEMSYHDMVLAGLSETYTSKRLNTTPKFQAFFCIDDREESLRRNLEIVEPLCSTYGSPAHFSIKALFQPENSQYYSQICPGNIKPKNVIKEIGRKMNPKKDIHFHHYSNKFAPGLAITQTVGFLSAVKLFYEVFKPFPGATHSSAFEHLDHESILRIKNDKPINDLGYQVGFTIDEMVDILVKELSSTGLTHNFSNIVYFIGHGGSSTNNPYFAGYNCGACSGKPSSVNARVFCSIANSKEVRKEAKKRGIEIPDETWFIGGLHDTTKDEIAFYDTENLPEKIKNKHLKNVLSFETALENNSKERARQFSTINIKKSSSSIHKKINERAYALFEPRPELNHSNNSLCIIGRRQISKSLFLDQRAFLNSYDWEKDKDGTILSLILDAATPVCGGINLEYFFSRTDNEKLGAGSKLPQNIIGLIGVSNGVKGDLRPGLPFQMIDMHDPLRLLMIIEQHPSTVLKAITRNLQTFNWFNKEWVKLAVISPKDGEISLFKNGHFESYDPIQKEIEEIELLENIIESSIENLPVYKLKRSIKWN